MLQTLTLYLNLFIKFLKISAIGFGGGWAIVNLLEEEVVNNSKWLSEEEFSDLVAIAASTPGPIALNAATYIGYKVGGLLGSAIASFAIILPPFLVILAIAYGISYYVNNPYVKGFLNGLKAVVLGLFTLSAYSVIRATLASLHTLHQVSLLLILTLFFIILVYEIRIDAIAAVMIVGLLGVLATILKIW
ncbi:MAG: chromate transporter [Sulfolobales archaeon]